MAYRAKTFDGLFNMLPAPAEWAGAEFRDSSAHLGDDFGKACSFPGGKVKHVEAFGFEADFREQLFGALDAAACAKIAFLEVAPTFEAAGYDDAVHAALERGEQIIDFNLAGAGQAQDAHGAGILKPEGSGQVRGGIGAIVATECNDDRWLVASG